MSAIPCAFSITCTPCDENPMGNYTSEGPEQVPVYLSLVFPESWDKAGCLTLCESVISQADADLCALAQAAQCNPPFVAPTSNSISDSLDGGGDTTITREQFFNAEQTCTVDCPGGGDFSYTVPAGTFSALTQEAADERANAYACMVAGRNQVCLSALSDTGACVGTSYSGTIDVFISSGLAIADISVSAGALPTGLTMEVTTLGDQNLTLTITGTPTTYGQFDFSIHAEDVEGNQTTEDYSMFVLEISPSTLPNGQVGVAYSQQMTVLGPTLGTVTWSVSSGTLPTGLTLNTSSGLISGTPTAAASYAFTIAAEDER